MYVPTPSHLYRHHLYRKLLSRVPADPFLDVGTGFGDVALYLARRGAAGVALDYGPEAVAEAKERLAGYGNVEVVEFDFLEYEPDREFALVTLPEILEHVEDDRAFMEKAAGVLQEGGRVLISVPARKALWGWRDDVKGHLRRYEREDLDGLVRGAGFEPEVFWCWGWPFISALRWMTGRPRLTEDGGAEDRTKVSGVHSEMKPWTRALVNPAATAVPFGIMDLFLSGDWGVGYVVLARKP
ncbi:MAG: class I SAM-dependent methyltransferase [Candidatus Coatesbacteria bacterium]|nr:MAG: class I SAM-dependent methyltransferase [Candidatus Coatesbacteria bacterium]